jgi:anhydro-N-acetylmuramic acid kinase
MIVAGVMSGTSADGINIAVIRTHGILGRSQQGPFTLLGHAEHPFPREVRQKILESMNASRVSVADLARLNFLLGELYAEAVLSTCKALKVKLELIGCHGQTLYHQGEAEKFLGKKLAVTWQTGEGAVIAARLGIPVVSDFRPADMAAGGQGAPLVPFLDYQLYHDRKKGRVVQNIGGIANLTAIPAAATSTDVVAFDTGPGNMVIDAVTERLYGKRFDRNGEIAAQGNVLEDVLSSALRQEFFRRRPPKTAGREEFGWEFVRGFMRNCGRAPKADVVATATALTAGSIADALRRYVVRGRRGSKFSEFIVSGGGANNSTLIRMLAQELAPLNLQVHFSDDFGLPSEAKEAVAFALLAYETWHRRPSNIPSATGARRPAILGKISYA